MTPFALADIIKPSLDKYLEATRELGIDDEFAKKMYEENGKEVCFKNDKYTVLVSDYEPEDSAFLLPQEMIWLSIRRNDREPVTDWRELQQIKNILVGPENEGLQLFPAESRLVDSSNQFHMVVLRDGTKRFQFGFKRRGVSDTPFLNSKQRPFSE